MDRSKLRTATIAALGLRVGYGVGLIVAPGRLGRRWLGSAAAKAPTQVPLRALGAREIVIHVGALGSALGDRAVRPWLLGSVAGDLTDLAATVVGRDQLPAGAGRATAIVGGGSAFISVVLAIAAER